MLTIAVDAMGGDFAPRAIIEGVAAALNDDVFADPCAFLLVGDEAVLSQELARVDIAGDSRLEIVHASQAVAMDDAPATALRSKRDSSINVAVGLVKDGRAGAVVSAGNTGAAVASTVVKLRMLAGVERPGIATIFPSPTGPFVLLDAGATVDCKPMHLVHYAIMGDVYARRILGHANPRIGVLSVGGEETKGNELSKETFKLLSRLDNIRFVGNVEGHDLFGGEVDVVVCDGFVGNVTLKCCESLAKAVSHILRRNLEKTSLRKLGYLLSRNAYRELKQVTDYAEYGGAPLLGVNGVCIIGHGSSSPRAVTNALRVAGEFILHQVNEHIVERIEHLGLGPEVDVKGQPDG
ncbi:MAG: phosphate acyltransferase PlsX [Lentisphaerae bacterium]|jgi:phosphate acyltransferase|nr:phosphate acyltransferase PlsX [Lentisphaerota bacterium]MBT4821117.1 phosphate acyltransferase PlsX [Lentisphaerota bacterium]MBT5610350.1 phosphate acyltransferase PlsX [Lentisphaerota bacterium]MBT7056178.1 phosphate acyltransferase PlsX [Lentisphaerota bacterium]MBT7841900.1 phosphate acyltransferase PlsX [Lentisphaerota bacterium]